MLDLSALNPQQREAVLSIHGPLLILAGAGTGKTRVITFRAAWMVHKGVRPENILAVTFTNKAAREMKQRVAQLLPKSSRPRDGAGPKHPSPTLCTFHALGARILREHIERLGYKRNFVIYDESEQLSTVKRILSHIAQGGPKVDPHEVLQWLSRDKTRDHGSAAGLDGSAHAMAKHLRKAYDAALRACNAVDFDDLLLLTLRLFQDHPEVLEACRRQYQHVMVDEYQDTNHTQFQLLHLLCQKHRNLCVVGDDDQSIYGWRGAHAANLLDLETHYRELKVVKLEQNYRSTNTILEAANAVILNNARRRGKKLWSQNGSGTKIDLYECATDEEEARTLAELIELARLGKRVPWGDQAILFRTNIQSRPLEMALRQAGIRYRVIGGQSYFDRREVRDFLAYLKMLVNPHNDAALLRIANVPARGLSEAAMEKFLAASQERRCSVFTAMRHSDVLESLAKRARESAARFVEWVEQTRQALPPEPGAPLRPWAERFLESAGYLEELKRSEKDPQAAENRVRNLKELVCSMDGSLPDNPGQTAEQRLLGFLEDLALESEREEEDKGGDMVTLITMHSCKGLEFPHVFVAGIEDGLLPHSRSKEEGTLDEERRLFYVALTRAMRTLTLSYCLGRKKYGQTVPCHPSRFLKELPSHLVEHAHERAKTPVKAGEGKSLFSAMRASLS